MLNVTRLNRKLYIRFAKDLAHRAKWLMSEISVSNQDVFGSREIEVNLLTFFKKKQVSMKLFPNVTG